jgi:hypothetical protein
MQSRRRSARYQAVHADLAGIGVAGPRTGSCRTAPTQAVRQHAGRNDGRACRDDAAHRIQYASQPLLLLRFDRFLQLHPGPQTEPLSAMIDRWAETNVTRQHAEECEKLKRVFAKILRHRDPSIPVRRPDPRPRKEAAKQWRKPHIYSPADVRRMLEVARTYPSPRAPLRPLSM